MFKNDFNFPIFSNRITYLPYKEFSILKSVMVYVPISQNRFGQSRSLFKTILEYPQFQSTGIILLLNQIDVFRETLSHIDFADYFPDYTGK